MKVLALFLMSLVASGSAYSVEESAENSGQSESVEDSARRWEGDSSESSESLALAAKAPDGWEDDALETINKLRKEQKLPELELDDDLTKEAKKMDQKVACEFFNPQPDFSAAPFIKTNVGVANFGDGLAAILGPSAKTAINNVIQQWNNQKSSYDCKKPLTKSSDPQQMYYKRVSNYVNMMRKDHDKVGLALVPCKANSAKAPLLVAVFGGGENAKDISKKVACPKPQGFLESLFG